MLPTLTPFGYLTGALTGVYSAQLGPAWIAQPMGRELFPEAGRHPLLLLHSPLQDFQWLQSPQQPPSLSASSLSLKLR